MKKYNHLIFYRLLSKKYNGLFKVQNTFPIKEDLIHSSIVLYKKNDLSSSKEKKEIIL